MANSENKKVVGFKKFSEIKGKSKVEEVDPSLNISPDTESDLPANPNLSKDSNKVQRIASRKNLIPKDQNLEVDSDEDEFRNDIDMDEHTHEGKVETFGKVAKFPKNTKASKAYNFLENVKVSKKSIWYIMVEKQDNELQMVKYNYREGVDLGKFVNELKTYYTKKYGKDRKVVEAISKIVVDGNDKYSMVKNIPAVTLDPHYQVPTYFIVGHDGSYNALYGTYNPITHKLSDFRDQVLFEFEKRVYNNLKLSNVIIIWG